MRLAIRTFDQREHSITGAYVVHVHFIAVVDADDNLLVKRRAQPHTFHLIHVSLDDALTLGRVLQKQTFSCQTPNNVVWIPYCLMIIAMSFILFVSL
jgi:hypothetical protein